MVLLKSGRVRRGLLDGRRRLYRRGVVAAETAGAAQGMCKGGGRRKLARNVLLAAAKGREGCESVGGVVGGGRDEVAGARVLIGLLLSVLVQKGIDAGHGGGVHGERVNMVEGERQTMVGREEASACGRRRRRRRREKSRGWQGNQSRVDDGHSMPAWRRDRVRHRRHADLHRHDHRIQCLSDWQSLAGVCSVMN